MEAQDRRNAVNKVVSVLRKATKVVKVAPFVYLCFYALYMLCEHFVSEEMLCVADALMTVTPFMVGGMLILSRLFELCAWHRAACSLPLLSQVEGAVDAYVVEFIQGEILAINVTIGVVTIVFLFLAIRHFSRGFKRTDRAYA